MNARPLALITGGTRGIGLATAARFAREGYDLLLVYRDRDADAHAATERLVGQTQVDCIRCDVTDPMAVSALIPPRLAKRAPAAYVHAAGGSEVCAAYGMDAAHIERMLGNLSGFLLVLAPTMRAMARGGGAIVAVTSIAGAIGIPGQAAYSAAKAGIVAAVRAAAREGTRFRIRVNAVMPALVDTEGLLVTPGAPPSSMGRLGTAEEVAEAIWFLCSPAASLINGAQLPVTGGQEGQRD